MENQNPNSNEQNQQQFNQQQFNQQQFNQQQFNQQQFNQGQYYNQGQYQQGYQQNMFYFDGQTQVSNEDRTAAWVCYLGLIGFIIALVMQNNNKTKIGAYHLRQALGLMLTSIVLSVACLIIVFVGWILLPVVSLGILVLMIIGIVNGAQGRFKPVPILGDSYNKWFAKTFE